MAAAPAPCTNRAAISVPMPGASTQVLDAVARTLRLDRAERWHLYVLAEAVPVVVSHGHCAVPEAIVEIVRSLDPLPAVVTNARFDILKDNDAYRDLFRDLHLMPCVQRNTLWCTITEPRTREMFPQYAETVRYMVARLRGAEHAVVLRDVLADG